MKAYTFQNNGDTITIRAYNYEAALHKLHELTHPADWELVEEDGHELTMTERILNTVDPVEMEK